MNRISVADAAKRLGVSQQFVRIGMQQGLLPIGTAVKMKRWVYYINPHQLETYLGTKKPSVTATTDGKPLMMNQQKGREYDNTK